MRAVLETTIEVHRVAVYAETAWLERRPELGLLCQTARNSENRISREVVQSVLPGLGDAGAKNVVAWCEMIGLGDENGGLTALGSEVADSNETPIPEQGVYDLWLAQHPVIGNRVLSAERLASNPDARFENVTKLTIIPDFRKVFRSVVNKNARFMIRALPSNQGQAHGLPRETNATCQFRWTLDFDQNQNRWQLDGRIEALGQGSRSEMVSIQHDSESNELDLTQLANQWGNDEFRKFGLWNPKKRRLDVPFKDVSVAEQDNFRKALELDQVNVSGKGRYFRVTIEDVPIAPIKKDEAQQWAMARFNHKLTDKPRYRSRAEVREQFILLTEDTPLEEFNPALPTHEDLLERYHKQPEHFWALAAPVDLAPFPITDEELDEFKVGSSTNSQTNVSSDGTIRVPYRCGWTMLQLVEALLDRAVPQRVLFCDRFVRGNPNMEALRLFVAALRQVAPSVVIDVWTENKEADFKKIENVTGMTPRSYEKFGRDKPHDRYLLVIPESSQPFGWQMSNSPLHARAIAAEENTAPDTPLSWKDLVATQIDFDALMPAFQHWIEGGTQ